LSSEPRNKARVLWVACGAHALHDGFTDTLYVLLPIWQAHSALSYAAIGVLRARGMAGFQVPVATVAQRIGGATTLAVGTAAATAAYLFLGTSYSVAVLAIALVLGGLGSSNTLPERDCVRKHPWLQRWCSMAALFVAPLGVGVKRPHPHPLGRPTPIQLGLKKSTTGR
jgi:hypothetical protein